VPAGNELLVVIGFPAAALLLALLFGVILPRVRRRRRLHGQIVVVPFTLPGGLHTTPVPRHTLARGVEAIAELGTESKASQPTGSDAATGTYGTTSTPVRSEAVTPRLQVVSSEPELPRGEARPQVRPMRPPVEATLQFLPGRLEIVEGRDVGQEIRFVRTPGAQITEVTIGRSSGPMYRHIQLHEPTVSRLHAKMTLEGRQWRITNLSATNPVVVNATPLSGEGTSVLLADGDRIELGEVVLRFRSS
jgi:hypothetical protein